MTEGCSDEKQKAVSQHAVVALEALLKDLEGKYGDEQYETEFLGDLYARMIVCVYMGYFPEKIGEEAEAAAIRLMKATGLDPNEHEEQE